MLAEERCAFHELLAERTGRSVGDSPRTCDGPPPA
jgi:hypothetical protein